METEYEILRIGAIWWISKEINNNSEMYSPSQISSAGATTGSRKFLKKW
ncbi:MAG TPA: hypothetical protein VMV32_11030 [Ignavibacteriaceae bacterium]|nr:hypothetical protein [Ignavibacteriaceae bacterium]